MACGSKGCFSLVLHIHQRLADAPLWCYESHSGTHSDKESTLHMEAVTADGKEKMVKHILFPKLLSGNATCHFCPQLKKNFFLDKARQSPYLSLTRMRRYDPDMSQGRSNQYLLAVLMTTSESYDLLHPVCKWGTCGLCEEEARQLVGSQITGKKIWIPSIRPQVLSPSSPPVPWLSPSIPSQTIWHQLSPQTPSPFLHWLLLSRDTR